MKKVALSTDNKNKVKEMLAILSKYNFEIVTKSELGVNEGFEEIYDTLEENSKLKAEKLREYCSFAVLADDTGLFVNALNGEPGVLSARYAGEHGNSEANREKLLKNLEGKSDRSAYFKTVIVFVDENGKEFIAKGILKGTISEVERGENGFGYDKIFIPENTAAVIFSQSGIEEIITEPGGYEYQNGESSVFNGDGLKKSLFDNVVNRVGFGGQSDQQKQICFVNLREIRDIRFGTRGPVMYNDLFYGTDLEVRAFGTFSIQITDAIKFVKNFLPANVTYYSFDSAQARAQIVTEFLQSFTVALNSLSTTYRISQLPSQASVLAKQVSNDEQYAGTWKERFGFEIVKVAIANIEFSPESKELVKKFSSNKMNLKAFDDVSQKDSNIAAQQKVASGIEQHGLGDGAGMIFGMNMAQQLDEKATKPSLSFDEQIEALTKLKSLLDAGILTQEEFDRKKKEIMDL